MSSPALGRPLGASVARRPAAMRSAVARQGAFYLATAVMVLVVLMALLAPHLGLQNPYNQNLEDVLRGPHLGGKHLLGTDDLGRDVFSRIAASFGFVYGLLAGFSRGIVGEIAMRISDIQLSIPPVILAVVFAVALTPGVKSVVLAVALVTWPQYARVIRAEVLRLRTTEFVRLARTAGLTRTQILRRHIVPNVLNSLVVLVTLDLSTAVLFASALSFLGAGVQQPRPDWGNMLASGVGYMQTSWWLVVMPGLAITIVILSMNIIGDRVRDLLDPKRKAR
jgi:peptide/nickel transport system permease protein